MFHMGDLFSLARVRMFCKEISRADLNWGYRADLPESPALQQTHMHLPRYACHTMKSLVLLV